jgi:hypothetical protein
MKGELAPARPKPLARASSESPTSNKSSFVNSTNSSGGNSSYFQTGSEVRSLHIAKRLSFRDSKLPFTVFSLATRPFDVLYCAFIHVSDPVSLTATSVKNSWNGPPSAVPRCSVEISRGPAFL